MLIKDETKHKVQRAPYLSPPLRNFYLGSNQFDTLTVEIRKKLTIIVMMMRKFLGRSRLLHNQLGIFLMAIELPDCPKYLQLYLT